MRPIQLEAGVYRLALDPGRGGSVARFDYDGLPLFRATCGSSILDTACFPLVPFSNRIAHGRFEAGGRAAHLPPNFPGRPHPHPLHGFGWLSRWIAEEATDERVVMSHEHPGAVGPWPYRAEQRLELDRDGLRHGLSVGNRADAPMFAGLGLHPYLPRTERTVYLGLHRGEWRTGEDGLPVDEDRRTTALDWWGGRPVASRPVDTVYSDREGSLRVLWPERRLELEITPSADLPFTTVYVPEDGDSFCVEPVSHLTDAINRLEPGVGVRWLAPGGTFAVEVRYRARRTG